MIFEGAFLPFGEYLSRLCKYRPDILQSFKNELRNFLVFKARKTLDEEKVFLVDPIQLLDLYIPPLNALVVIRVIDVNKNDKFSLEVYNYIFDLISLQEQGIGFIAESGEEIYVEFYMVDDELFTESVKNLKSVYKSSESIYGGINLLREDVFRKIEKNLKNIGYDLVAIGEVFSEKKLDKAISIMTNLIKEVV